jgi:membrane protease YdiL (CAAX protease family)
MRRTLSALGLIGLTYALVRAFWIASDQEWTFLYRRWADGALKVGLWVAPPSLALALCTRLRLRRAAGALGLLGSVGRGYGFGLVATAPMLAAWVAAPSGDTELGTLVGNAVLGPLAEEVLFRGVLFAGLVRLAGWRLAPALAVSAVAFGLAHVTEVDWRVLRAAVWWLAGDGFDGVTRLVATAWQTVLMVSAGGVLFGYLYHRWGSLWPAIGLHSFINLWWELSDGSRGPLGASTWMSVAHVLSIGIAIYAVARRPARPEGRPARQRDPQSRI